MEKIKHFSSLFLAIWMGFVETESFHEVPAPKAENTNIETNYAMKSTENIRKVGIEEGDDDYGKCVKVVVHGAPKLKSAVLRERSWKGGIVPYEISNRIEKRNRNVLYEAMDEIMEKSCIIFRKRSNETLYMRYILGSGCKSYVGKPVSPGDSTMELGPLCLQSKASVLHELMHILGFFHEHNRPDRDDYIMVNKDNIMKEKAMFFKKKSAGSVLTLDLPYDYDSITHYGRYAYAKNRWYPTIVPLQENVNIGQRKGLSEIDVKKINLLYMCEDIIRLVDFVTILISKLYPRPTTQTSLGIHANDALSDSTESIRNCEEVVEDECEEDDVVIDDRDDGEK